MSSHFDVICDVLLNRRTATWNLFVLFNKETNNYSSFYFKIFHLCSKVGLFPLWRTRKKSISRNLLSIQNEAISLVALRSKELWLDQDNHATVKLDLNGFPWKDFQRKQKRTAKSTNRKENAGKIKLVFVNRAACKPKSLMLPWISQELKEYARKPCERHLIRVLNERGVNDGGNLCPLWLVILKSVSQLFWDWEKLNF